jgi:hypothetical protein
MKRVRIFGTDNDGGVIYRDLPTRADIEHLKNQAKNLLKDFEESPHRKKIIDIYTITESGIEFCALTGHRVPAI